MAIKIIDDTILQDIAVSIQSKDSGGKMETTEMASRIEALPTYPPDFDMTVTDNQIKMVIELTQNDINPLECGITFFQTVANDVAIDWGDGTTEISDSSIGGDLYHYTRYVHNYSKIGIYLITLTAQNGGISIPANTYAGGAYLINSGGNFFNTSNVGYYNSLYKQRLKKLAIGDNVVLDDGVFNGYPCLSEINRIIKAPSTYEIPSGFSTGISILNIPENVKQLKKYLFASSGNGINGFLTKVVFPSTLTSIGDYAFNAQFAMKVYDFTKIQLVNGVLPFTVQSHSFNSFNANNNTIFLFATQEIAEVAKATTNLSVYANYITYEGA